MPESRQNVKIRIPHKNDKETSVRVYGSNDAIQQAIKEMEEVWHQAIEP